MNTMLFILLLIAHWAGDYTQLSMPSMLAAKKLGKPILPIFLHAWIHAVLTLAALVIVRSEGPQLILGPVIMLTSHFLIDLWKGRMNVWFPALQNTANVYHWWIFGLDQLFHTLILLWIACL